LTDQQVRERTIQHAQFPIVKSVIYVTVTLFLLVLPGCVLRPSDKPLGGTQPLVKIGLAAPFEGSDRLLGYEALAGVKLALAERNAAGGVAGYMVELVALNDFGEPDEASLQAREFAADPAVLGVVTGWTDETAHASLPFYRQVGLAVVVPWSVVPELADPESGVVLVAADAQQMAGTLSEAVAATRPDRLVVVGEEPSASPYKESLSRMGLQAQVIPPPSALDHETSKDWAARLVLSRVRPPDVLILATDGALAGEALVALNRLDWVGATFGGVEAGSVNLVNVAGGVATGLTFASPAPAGRDMPQIEADWGQGKEELGPRAVLAYDATLVLLDAIELAIREVGSPSRQGVVTALPAVRRRGLTGDIVFDATGRRVDAPVWLYRIVHGNYPGQMRSSP
jgi:branched-chain amino acid transport system substrate-binding protein